MTSKRKPAKSSASKSAQRAVSVAADAGKSVEERVAALAEIPHNVCESDENLQTVLRVLKNSDEPIEVRLEALQTLQAASFAAVAFEGARRAYIAALRKVAQDPHPELRQRVLGILSREKDGFAQKKLLEGLRHPEKALLPPEKALQLLSYDIHADAYPVAREIASTPPNSTAKREALRLLAADAEAAPMFEQILRDKAEDPELRQISMAALQAIRPEKLQAHAREMVLDASEQDDVQATCLTALTQFGDKTAVAEDRELLDRVEFLKGAAKTKVKQSARQFLSKYSR